MKNESSVCNIALIDETLEEYVWVLSVKHAFMKNYTIVETSFERKYVPSAWELDGIFYIVLKSSIIRS